MDTYAALNDVLVNLFRDIMELEEQAIITQEYQDITNNDMHVIEAIGVGEPKNMSTIAKLLSVTVGTLTIAMNSLVKKGYVLRERGKEDRRVVYISLSEKGLRAYRHHEEFHRQMIEAVLENLTEDETESLVKALAKLERWFSLSEKGLRAYRHHEEFHRQMIEAVLENLTEDETESLVKALAKLERWFRRTEEN